jgi:heme/copper-type cytochrome/quinol oxidase subunit 2
VGPQRIVQAAMDILIRVIAIIVLWVVIALAFTVVWYHMKKGHHASPLDGPRVPSDPAKPDPHSDREKWPPIR